MNVPLNCDTRNVTGILDQLKVNADFFSDGKWKSNFLINMGYGDPAPTATAFAIAVHAVNLIVNSTLGIFGFIQEGISLGQLSHGVREMRKPSG